MKSITKPTAKTNSTTDDVSTISVSNITSQPDADAESASKSMLGNADSPLQDEIADRTTKRTNPQMPSKLSVVTSDARVASVSSKSSTSERSSGNSAARSKSNPAPPTPSSASTKNMQSASIQKPMPAPAPAPEPIEQVPVLSRKQKKNKPAPPRPVVKVPKEESAKTESVTPSAPSSPVSTLLRFEDGSSPPTPLTAEPTMPPEPSLVGMLVDLASQYEIERLSFFDSQSYNTKLTTPLRYGPLVQALSTLSMSGTSAARTITPGTIDTAVTSFQQLLETLTQTISDMLRTLPRTTWDDTSSFDGVLKDMLKAEEFLEENTDELPNWRDDDVTVLTQALEKRARWMEIQLIKLEELHRDINTSAVRSVLDQNDRGWGPRPRDPKGESLARFEQLGYIEENGIKRVMNITELEVALAEAKEQEAVTEAELKEAMLAAY